MRTPWDKGADGSKEASGHHATSKHSDGLDGWDAYDL